MKLWLLILVLMHVDLFSAQVYPSATTPIYQPGGSQTGQYQPGVGGINIGQLPGSAYNPNVQQGGIPIGNQQIVQSGYNSGIQQGNPYGVQQGGYQGVPQINYQGIPQTNYQGVPQTNYQGIPQTNYPQQFLPQNGNFQAPGPITFPG